MTEIVGNESSDHVHVVNGHYCRGVGVFVWLLDDLCLFYGNGRYGIGRDRRCYE